MSPAAQAQQRVRSRVYPGNSAALPRPRKPRTQPIPATRGVRQARVLRPLQAAACTYRVAFGPRAGQKVLTLQGVMPRETLQGGAVRRDERFQSARRRALQGRRAPSARATLPLHHPPSAGQRARASQRRRSGGAEGQDSLTRRHHALGDVAAGVHAAAGGAGSTPGPASPLTVCEMSARATAVRPPIQNRECRRRVGQRRSVKRVRRRIADGQVGWPDSCLSWLPGLGHKRASSQVRFGVSYKIVAEMVTSSLTVTRIGPHPTTRRIRRLGGYPRFRDGSPLSLS